MDLGYISQTHIVTAFGIMRLSYTYSLSKCRYHRFHQLIVTSRPKYPVHLQIFVHSFHSNCSAQAQWVLGILLAARGASYGVRDSRGSIRDSASGSLGGVSHGVCHALGSIRDRGVSVAYDGMTPRSDGTCWGRGERAEGEWASEAGPATWHLARKERVTT